MIESFPVTVTRDGQQYLNPCMSVVIEDRKFTDYLLDFGHDDGKHKARLFKSVLDITLTNYKPFIELISKLVYNYPIDVNREDRFGKRYSVHIPMQGRDGEVKLLTCWVEKTENIGILRLTTAYPDIHSKEVGNDYRKL